MSSAEFVELLDFTHFAEFSSKNEVATAAPNPPRQVASCTSLIFVLALVVSTPPLVSLPLIVFAPKQLKQSSEANHVQMSYMSNKTCVDHRSTQPNYLPSRRKRPIYPTNLVNLPSLTCLAWPYSEHHLPRPNLASLHYWQSLPKTVWLT